MKLCSVVVECFLCGRVETCCTDNNGSVVTQCTAHNGVVNESTMHCTQWRCQPLLRRGRSSRVESRVSEIQSLSAISMDTALMRNELLTAKVTGFWSYQRLGAMRSVRQIEEYLSLVHLREEIVLGAPANSILPFRFVREMGEMRLKL